MNVQGFQKLTLLDFPGKVACTVFTGGCNLRCPFCHNAGLVKNPCEFPNAEEEVLSYLTARKSILKGVCVTGGEPLLQPDLLPFLQKIKDLGLAVKLDTNGGLPQKLKAAIESGLVDFIAMDIKSAPETYESAVGIPVNVNSFLESIQLIKESGVAHEFRTTAVKGLHQETDFTEIAKLVGNSPYYLQKFTDSGNLISGEGFSAFTDEEMTKILAEVKRIAPNASARGYDLD